ncbi:MAG: indole acetimide hydrolase [Actinobacteria bacterium]|nr:indole acetimide hydrolase [Actinomycetota bacterium]
MVTRLSIDQARARHESGAAEFANHLRSDARADQHGIFWFVSDGSGDAAGPLAGVPFGVKDNVAVAGMPMTCGTPAFRGYVPEAEGAMIASVRAAGADCLGKVGLHELGFGTTSNNGMMGPVRNPNDTSRVPGGSSGGSAAAVAAGLVAFAIGNDTGGSMRIPGAYCGVVGMRPTTHRYPAGGAIMLSNSRDTCGVFANSVADVALVDGIITADTELPKIAASELRLGVPRKDFWQMLQPEVAAACEAALQKLAAAGATVIETEVTINGVGVHELAEKGAFPMVAYETMHNMPTFIAGLPEPYRSLTVADVAEQTASPDVHAIMEHMVSQPIPRDVYEQTVQMRHDMLAAYADALHRDNLHALVYPTVPMVAPEIGQEIVVLDGVDWPVFQASIRNTDPGSMAGQPAITVPVPVAKGALPVGLGIECAVDADRLMLGVAAAIEACLAN